LKVVVESVEHFEASSRVIEQAFSSSEFGHNGEAQLVNALRKQSTEYFGLVAIEEAEVVGHIAFSRAKVLIEDIEVPGMGLAPIAVDPAKQRIGIGKALIHHGLQECRNREAAFVVVAGDPSYYPQFGFQPAAKFGIQHGFAGMPQEVLLINPLTSKFDPGQLASGGRVIYDAAFGPQFNGSAS